MAGTRTNQDRAFFAGESHLPEDLVADLRRMNPWWEGKPMPVLPATRRHFVSEMTARLGRRLAPVVLLRGPRQIGKTTALLHLIEELLARGCSPHRILRVQFDDLPSLGKLAEPILRIAEWFERTVLGKSLNQAAREQAPACIFLDEVQNLEQWAPQLKSLVDHATVGAVVTGSSALRLEMGRDSLAGRISTINAGVLSLTEIAAFAGPDLGRPYWEGNGLEALTDREYWRALTNHGVRLARARDSAFSRFSARGGYPLAHARADVPWEYVADQLIENVIERVIRHDLRAGERGRKRDQQLLAEVFRLACRYAGQSPAFDTLAREAHRALGANVGPQRISRYLRFLGDTLLLRLVPPLEIRLKRKRGAPKLCLADHGLRASWLQELVPLDPAALASAPHLTTMAGHIAESATGALLSTLGGLDLSHFPGRSGEPEVDFVLTVGARRIPLEIKYQRRIDPLRDTEGLRAFMEKTANNAPFGILVVQTDEARVDDPRIVTLPLSTLMLLR